MAVALTFEEAGSLLFLKGVRRGAPNPISPVHMTSIEGEKQNLFDIHVILSNIVNNFLNLDLNT